MFDVSGLTEVKMKKMRGWQGSYYVNNNDKCVAKTCYDCRKILPVSSFLACSANKYGLKSQCNECAKTHKRVRRAKHVGDFTIGVLQGRASSVKRSNRSPEKIEEDRKRLRPDGVKKCRSCLVDYAFSEFHVDVRSPDGLYSMCKPCAIVSAIRRANKHYLHYWEENNIPVVCYVCGGPWEHSDHVVPLIIGGEDSPSNVLPMCAEHNMKKNRYPLREWLSSSYPDIADEVIKRVISYGVVLGP